MNYKIKQTAKQITELFVFVFCFDFFVIFIVFLGGLLYGVSTFMSYPIYPTPPLGQDVTQGQFFLNEF